MRNDVLRNRSTAAAAVFALIAAGVFLNAEAAAWFLSAQSTTATLASGDVARLMAEAPKVDEVRLSPDGANVVYRVTRGSVAANQYVTELFLQALDTSGAPHDVPVHLDRRVTGTQYALFTPQWCPDGSCVTYFATPPTAETASEAKTAASAIADGSPALMRYDVSSRSVAPIPLRDIDANPVADTSRTARSRINTVGRDYRWSPRGRFIAFTASLGPVWKLNPRGGVRVSAQWHGDSWKQENRHGLFVLDIATGDVEQLSPDTLHVMQFDWAPDEHAVVVSATLDGGALAYIRPDLFIINRKTRAVRPLVTQPGCDSNPAWSPDGHWIVFSSNFGVHRWGCGSPAVVPAAGGTIARLGSEDDPGPGPNSGFWTSDSRLFYYPGPHRMTKRLFKLDLKTRRVVPVSADERPFDDHFSWSADGRWLAYSRESSTTAPEVMVQPFPTGPPRQLTRLAADFPITALVRSERVSWKSRDRKFTIHGLLLTPRSAWLDDGASQRVTNPLPTLAYLVGGPGMISDRFAGDYYGGHWLTLASRGYAVLVPNTRLRGGYGFDFWYSDGTSYGRLPYEDMMGGVDLLVRRGIANPNQLGILGGSYGGYLTSYAITQTPRFKAAVVQESHVEEFFVNAIAAAPGTDRHVLMRGIFGIRNPLDTAERRRVFAESPIFNMAPVSTPTLLLFGANSNQAHRVGRPLFGALQWLKIPSEFVLYDEGHGIDRPAAIADSLTRTTDWFDYWVRGMPYLDAERQREYDAWRAARRNHRSAR